MTPLTVARSSEKSPPDELHPPPLYRLFVPDGWCVLGAPRRRNVLQKLRKNKITHKGRITRRANAKANYPEFLKTPNI